MRKRFVAGALALAFAVTIGLAGCGSTGEDTGPDYADDEAMTLIAEGLEARWEISDAPDSDGSTANLAEAVNAELAVIEGLRDRQFEDSGMQEDVISYINLLDDSIEVLETYTQDSTDYYTQWVSVYNERTALINTFVNEYGLEVGDEYADTLSELTVAGKAAQESANIEAALDAIVGGATFEKIDEGYGSFTYSAVLENTTGYDLENVGIVLSLYDADGVKAEETYASANSWLKGEKVRFEAYSSTDAATVKATVDYYSTAS